MARLVRFGLGVVLVASCLALVGCPRLDVIAVSNDAYDFALNDTPWTFQVWNADPSLVEQVSFTVKADQAWLKCTPASGTSSDATGPDGKKVITVTVNRNGLAKGQYKGTITISARNAVSKEIAIRMRTEGSEGSGGWSLKNVVVDYAPPYLVEFSLSLRDDADHAVLAEPAQFAVKCMEDGVALSSEAGSHFAKGANKQLLTYLVLDYTLSMANLVFNPDADDNGRSDAIDKMEDAAKNVFLESLNEDAQVGIYEFHRADEDPQRIADFSTDKGYLRDRIDAIWPMVGQFPADTRCWDALFAAVQEFSQDNEARKDEQRAIIFLSDGHDESSAHSYQNVIDAARQRGIAFYCIGFGEELDLTALQIITSQTGGQYYAATTADEMGARFQQITNDLGGQYILRWATLKRSEQTFVPSFSLGIQTHTLRYTAQAAYRPADHAGDPLHGVLRVVPSESANTSVAYLRAAYVPRYITTISLRIVGLHPFVAHLVGAAEGGLCDDADWDLSVTDDPSVNDAPAFGKLIVVQTHAPENIFTAIPYAAFGSILRFEFDSLVEDPSTLFSTLEVDNTIYAGGQTFELNWPPQ